MISMKSHVCFVQGRVTHDIHKFIYGNEILLEENILGKIKEKLKGLNMLQIPHTTQQLPIHNMQKVCISRNETGTNL